MGKMKNSEKIINKLPPHDHKCKQNAEIVHFQPKKSY